MVVDDKSTHCGMARYQRSELVAVYSPEQREIEDATVKHRSGLCFVIGWHLATLLSTGA